MIKTIELNEKQREDLKKVQLELLFEFSEFCKKNNLRFYLIGGTLLGAIRHKGYIPWDDDIDVGMPREDYDKFCEIYKSEKYFLQNTFTDRAYPYHFSKLIKNGTVYKELMTCRLNTKDCIFIDIFPINGIPDKNNFSKFHYYFWLFIFNKHSFSYKFVDYKVIKRDFTYKAMTILSWILLWWCPYNLSARMRDSFVKRHQYKKSTKCTVGGELRYVFDKTAFEGVQYIDFENMKMPIMGDPEPFLKYMYGDYMELPKAEDRIPHHFLTEFKA